MKFTKDYILTDCTPESVNLVIKLFRENGIPVYSGTTEYNKAYPYLYYDKGNYLCQRVCYKGYSGELISTVSEFLKIFGINNEIAYEIF
jgi:hypothetical protein